MEAEEHEVKRLRFDKEGDVRETASQTVSSEGSVRAEEAETASSPPEKDRENRNRQHCTEDDEEEEEEEGERRESPEYAVALLTVLILGSCTTCVLLSLRSYNP